MRDERLVVGARLFAAASLLGYVRLTVASPSSIGE